MFMAQTVKSGFGDKFSHNHLLYFSLPSTMQRHLGTIHYSINVLLKPKGRRSSVKVKKPIKLVSQLRNIYYFPSNVSRLFNYIVIVA